MRARSRAYYAANRERVLAKAAAKRGEPKTSALTNCSECGAELEGRQGRDVRHLKVQGRPLSPVASGRVCGP